MAAPFPPGRIKRGRASLIGGLATGACVLTLWVVGAHALGFDGAGAIASGALVAAAVAGWIRLADL